MAEEQVLSFFETLDRWTGLTPDTEIVQQGRQSGLWADATRVNLVSLSGPMDWSQHRGLRLWVHSSVANGRRIDLASSHG